MSKQQSTGDDPQIGADPSEVEETNDADVADALGFSVGAVDREAENDAIEDLVSQLGDDVDPVVASLLEALVEKVQRQEEELEELREEQEHTHDVASNAVALAQTNEVDVEELDEREERTREVAKSALAKAEQADADPDQQEDAEDLPAGVEPSTSPLDFFANCREEKIREMFVERSNRSNTFRAVKAAKWWPEFAHERTDGSGIFWTRDDLESALTAMMGEAPHRMTVQRVWQKLRDDLGADVKEKTRQVGRRQEPKDILCMDIEAAERLLEKRYIGMDLLDGAEKKATTGGVTPVVTGEA